MTGTATRTRYECVAALVAELREAHPEMRRPVRTEGIAAILERECIAVTRAPIGRRGYIDGEIGNLVITLRAGLDPRLHTHVLLHEYGHAKLHMADSGEGVRQLGPCVNGDPREYEADLFAAMLWRGPVSDDSDDAVCWSQL